MYIKGQFFKREQLLFTFTGVKKGTLVLTPTLTLPVNGEGKVCPADDEGAASFIDGEEIILTPSTVGQRGGFVPIESLRPYDLVIGFDSKPHKVLNSIHKQYEGSLVGIQHVLGPDILWLTPDYLVLAKPRPRTLGGHRDWSSSPISHLERRRELRREASPAERKLWRVLRNKQLGFKFRRQHPIGPYIADFYSRDAHLVVEVDGITHFTEDAIEYDKERNVYMRAFGLDVLRFTTLDVETNLDGVYLAIKSHCCLRTESIEGAHWIQSGVLLPGDIVFLGVKRIAATIEKIENNSMETEIFTLELENSHSFITGVCVARS